MRSLLALNEVRRLDGSVALVVRGVVDDVTVEQFESTLTSIGTGSRPPIIDLTACQLASAGLEALKRLQRRSRTCPAATLLVGADVDLLRTLRIVGLTSRFRVCATQDASLRSRRLSALPVAASVGPSRRVRRERHGHE